MINILLTPVMDAMDSRKWFKMFKFWLPIYFTLSNSNFNTNFCLFRFRWFKGWIWSSRRRWWYGCKLRGNQPGRIRIPKRQHRSASCRHRRSLGRRSLPGMSPCPCLRRRCGVSGCKNFRIRSRSLKSNWEKSFFKLSYKYFNCLSYYVGKHIYVIRIFIHFHAITDFWKMSFNCDIVMIKTKILYTGIRIDEDIDGHEDIWCTAGIGHTPSGDDSLSSGREAISSLGQGYSGNLSA